MKTYTLTWTNKFTREQNSNLLTIQPPESEWPDMVPRRLATKVEAEELLKAANSKVEYKRAIHKLVESNL